MSRWPTFATDEIEAVIKVLQSGKVNYWTGEQVEAFEEEFSNAVNARYGIAVANGSVAIELALRSINIKPNDEIIVTCRSFIASASSIVNAGGIPVFADVDLETQNISATTIQKVISNKTRAILCVHLNGWPCDMDPIIDLAREKNLLVIEDCAQAHGARYKGRPVGALGDIACWSFCQDKIISTGGEGGMVTTNNRDLWSKMWSYKDHGKSIKQIKRTPKKEGFRWLHDNIGTNWRLTEIQAAIGRLQLAKLPVWSRKRRENADAIWNFAKKLENIRVPTFKCSGCPGDCSANDGCIHAAYKCYVFAKEGEAQRNRILVELNRLKVPCFQGICPEIYLEKAFSGSKIGPNKRLPNAKRLGETSLMFLCDQTIEASEIKNFCEALQKCSE